MIKKIFARLTSFLWEGMLQNTQLRRRLDEHLNWYWDHKRATAKNPLNKFGQKYFSQSDEDGLTLEILRRLGINNGVFIELGCGNGLENNSLILVMNGWRGVWVGQNQLKVNLSGNQRVVHIRDWVTLDNCTKLLSDGLGKLGEKNPSLISLDLDGNDLFFAEKILKEYQPEVFVVEYNGKFPPPVKFSIAYDASHDWDSTDYVGASLQSFNDLFEKNGYQAVCCNLTGTNAYFVKKKHAALFSDVPSELKDVFMPCDYNWFYIFGHPTSPKTVQIFLDRK